MATEYYDSKDFKVLFSHTGLLFAHNSFENPCETILIDEWNSASVILVELAPGHYALVVKERETALMQLEHADVIFDCVITPKWRFVFDQPNHIVKWTLPQCHPSGSTSYCSWYHLHLSDSVTFWRFLKHVAHALALQHGICSFLNERLKLACDSFDSLTATYDLHDSLVVEDIGTTVGMTEAEPDPGRLAEEEHVMQSLLPFTCWDID
ncbi:hypothetical protein BKA93DRAFT_752318 [Sparassis latifolia]